MRSRLMDNAPRHLVISLGVMHQELDYRRLERLAATQREEWRLRQQWTDEEKRRELTDAALEALKAVGNHSAAAW